MPDQERDRGLAAWAAKLGVAASAFLARRRREGRPTFAATPARRSDRIDPLVLAAAVVVAALIPAGAFLVIRGSGDAGPRTVANTPGVTNQQPSTTSPSRPSTTTAAPTLSSASPPPSPSSAPTAPRHPTTVPRPVGPGSSAPPGAPRCSASVSATQTPPVPSVSTSVPTTTTTTTTTTPPGTTPPGPAPPPPCAR
jgi:hypothetical protein